MRSLVAISLCIFGVLFVSPASAQNLLHSCLASFSCSGDTPGESMACLLANRVPKVNSSTACYSYRFEGIDENSWAGYSTGCQYNNGNPAPEQYDSVINCEGQCVADQSIGVLTWTEPNTPGCYSGCAITQDAGVEACFPSNGTCAASFKTTGMVCDYTNGTGEDASESPDGCHMDDGTIVCDCLVNPSSPFCPGGDNGDDCTVVDGVAHCDPTNPTNPNNQPDPDDPSDSGDPGSSQNPGDTDGDGIPNEDEDDDGDGIPNHDDPDSPYYDGNDSGPGIPEGEPSGNATSVGDCKQAPTCTGDAIQCAMLKQQWKMTCHVLDLGDNKAPWDDDPDWGRDLKTESDYVDVGNMIEDTGGGGSCPADESLDVLGATIVISYQPFCDYAGIIRFFVILSAWVTAGFIVMRAL